jgi:CheY-like chemotaxis protein
MTAALILLSVAAVAAAAHLILRARRPAAAPEPAAPAPAAEATPKAAAAPPVEIGTVTLAPAAEAPAPPAAETPAPPSAAAEPATEEPRPLVLVVDDESAVRSSTARLLARAGYEVLQAGSADEALGVVHGDRTVDVMLSDVVMPGANGFELAGAVRDVSPGTEILLFTGYTPAAIDRHNLRGDSEIRLLQKPFERQALLDAVAAAAAAHA